MEVRIGGRLGFSLFPGFHVTLEDVRIRNRGADGALFYEDKKTGEVLEAGDFNLDVAACGSREGRPRTS
jgi:hypothetical protein